MNYAAFGLVMVLFLVFEPDGLVGIWRRVRDWFVLWPFQQRPLAGLEVSAGAGAPLLTLEQVEVAYHRVITAVQGVSLNVPEHGQIVALLGTNGAGKTTTLRAISGFLGLDDARVTAGSVSTAASASRTCRRTRSRRAASSSCPSATRSSPT